MELDYKKELEKVVGDLVCPKDFKCCTEGLENLCKATDVGLESHIECLEQNSFECPFTVPFGGLYYCECPLRVYIAKKFKK
jgi:hypothetical protein